MNNNRKLFRTGLDFDHAKMAMRELARFHALGMAVKYKRPEFFEQSKPIVNALPFYLDNSEFEDVMAHTFKLICSDPRTAEYEGRVKAAVDANKGWDSFKEIKAVEPWVSYTHGDFWVNNMMFRQGTRILFLFRYTLWIQNVLQNIDQYTYTLYMHFSRKEWAIWQGSTCTYKICLIIL